MASESQSLILVEAPSEQTIAEIKELTKTTRQNVMDSVEKDKQPTAIAISIQLL